MVLKIYNSWCLSVTPDILNIPEIPYIPPITLVPDIPDIPFYYHAKSGCPSSKIGQVIAIFIKCAKFVTEQERQEQQQHILPL